MKEDEIKDIPEPLQVPSKRRGCSTYAFEFLSIFVAVVLAFALNNWNDNRRDRNVEIKILKEIENGLKRDIEDIKLNVAGHQEGVRACRYWQRAIVDSAAQGDSLQYYFFSLTRNFISVQNRSGYESLKSKGLELIQEDSLRFGIISLYEYDFSILKKLEEEYHEMQFHANYADQISQMLAPYFRYDTRGVLAGIDTPIKLSHTDRQRFLMYLTQIQMNRRFALYYYSDIEKKISQLDGRIKHALKK